MADDDEDKRVTLEDRGIFLLSGEVDDDTCPDIIRWIFEENFDRRHEALTLVVNSPGGSVTCGFSVIDAMNGSRLPVRTVGMGEIASMGLSIFITGEKGKRILTPNTLIMSHQWSAGVYGKEHELLAGIKQNNLLTEMFLRHYKKHTGLSVKKIRDYLLPPSDVYLSAKEAKKLNICDAIHLF